MAIDTNGSTYEYRTLHFHGYAYGSSNVSLTVTVNGTIVFSGEVTTIDPPTPPTPADWINTPLLFSIDNSALFPTNWSGSYPMSVEVHGGSTVVLNGIFSNYMQGPSTNYSIMENATIDGTTLTIDTVSAGNVTVGQTIYGNGVTYRTNIVSGNDLTWTVNISQSVPSAKLTGVGEVSGTATDYLPCFAGGYPVNSEQTVDPRSSVIIDGIQQVPPLPKSTGVWTWVVPTGSTISYNLNVGIGSCAQV